MGWRGRALEGSSFIDLFDDSPDIREAVERALSEQVYADIIDMIYESSVGVKHLRATTLSLDVERDRGVLVVVRDVLDVKRMEQEMFQAEKMTPLGRLAASVVHEVRNPLGAVMIQLQLVAEDVEQVKAQTRTQVPRWLHIARMEIQRLDRIVGNFLLFSRSPRHAFEPLQLNDVVRRVSDIVAPEAGHQGVAPDLVLQGLPRVLGDEGQLAQDVLNRAVNAFQAIDGEGAFRASTVLHLFEGVVKLVLVKVFDLCYTTKAEGLGLSTTQHVIYEHWGTTDVASEAGQGATFTVSLPATESTDG